MLEIYLNLPSTIIGGYLAENKLSTNRDVDRSGELIKIKILAIDKNEFDSLC